MGRESDSPKIRVEIPWKGVPWKGAGILLAVLLSGASGGYTFNDLKNGHDDVKAIEAPPGYHVQFVKSHKETHAVLNESVGSIGDGMKEIRDTQINQVAREHADRVAEEIKDRRKWKKKYNWLVDKNTERLKRGDPTCSDINCSGR